MERIGNYLRKANIFFCFEKVGGFTMLRNFPLLSFNMIGNATIFQQAEAVRKCRSTLLTYSFSSSPNNSQEAARA
jgi:hypothetical protein